MHTEIFEGTLIGGKYRVGRPLGQGGMGWVLAATHVVTGRAVALKLLHGPMVADPAFRERFLREIRLSSNLNHRNIVDVFDAGEDEHGGLYMAMEHLDGETMEDWSLSSRFTQKKALRIIMQVARAIAYAHERGVIHRDLKPDNVFVFDQETSPMYAKVLDFGIAKPMAHPSVTCTGTVMGTPGYMSPEQGLTPEKVGPASDVWSLGVMLYETVTGNVPFDGENPNVILVRALSEPHAPVRGDVDERMRSLIDICLRKLPEDRISASEVADRLAEILRTDFRLGDKRAPQTPPKAHDYSALAKRFSATANARDGVVPLTFGWPSGRQLALLVLVLVCIVGVASAYAALSPWQREASSPPARTASQTQARPPTNTVQVAPQVREPRKRALDAGKDGTADASVTVVREQRRVQPGYLLNKRPRRPSRVTDAALRVTERQRESGKASEPKQEALTELIPPPAVASSPSKSWQPSSIRREGSGYNTRSDKATGSEVDQKNSAATKLEIESKNDPPPFSF